MKEIELIIIAMDEELSSLINKLTKYNIKEIDNEKIYLFNKNNKNYIVIKGKIGKVATAFHIGKLSSIYKINRIYNIGTSGAYSNSLNIGDVVIATEVAYFDVDVTGFGYKMGQVPQCPETFKCEQINKLNTSNKNYNIHYGLVASSDSFITKMNREEFPLDKLQPLCVEMEAGAVGQCAHLLNIPFIVIRSISDQIYQENNAGSFDENITFASNNCVDVLLSTINY